MLTSKHKMFLLDFIFALRLCFFQKNYLLYIKYFTDLSHLFFIPVYFHLYLFRFPT